jgi:predicted metal-dependent hydrolase
MTSLVYDPLYLRGIELFNQHRFFVCHEVWEQLWIGEDGPSRQFYKGLIQTAVALHHLVGGNAHGATKLLTSSRRYLEPYRPKHQGLDVDRLLADMASCFDRGIALAEDPENRAIPASLFPQIELDPKPA